MNNYRRFRALKESKAVIHNKMPLNGISFSEAFDVLNDIDIASPGAELTEGYEMTTEVRLIDPVDMSAITYDPAAKETVIGRDAKFIVRLIAAKDSDGKRTIDLPLEACYTDSDDQNTEKRPNDEASREYLLKGVTFPQVVHKLSQIAKTHVFRFLQIDAADERGWGVRCVDGWDTTKVYGDAEVPTGKVFRLRVNRLFTKDSPILANVDMLHNEFPRKVFYLKDEAAVEEAKRAVRATKAASRNAALNIDEEN